MNKKEGNKEESNEERKEGEKKGREGMRRKQKHRIKRVRKILCNPMNYIAHQASLSMGFPKEEYWSGLAFLSPGDLPNPGVESASPALAGGFFIPEPPAKPRVLIKN